MPLVALRRLSVAVVSAAILFLTWAVPPGRAEGIIYAVPNQPPPVKESVDFTNHLNHRVRHLPESLDPPRAETPAQVEARIHTLEHGVVMEPSKGKSRNESKAGASSGSTPVAVKAVHGNRGGGSHTGAATTSAPGPLSVAFIGAGVLAALGLLLSARGMRRQVRTG